MKNCKVVYDISLNCRFAIMKRSFFCGNVCLARLQCFIQAWLHCMGWMQILQVVTIAVALIRRRR